MVVEGEMIGELCRGKEGGMECGNGDTRGEAEEEAEKWMG